MECVDNLTGLVRVKIVSDWLHRIWAINNSFHRHKCVFPERVKNEEEVGEYRS